MKPKMLANQLFKFRTSFSFFFLDMFQPTQFSSCSHQAYWTFDFVMTILWHIQKVWSFLMWIDLLIALVISEVWQYFIAVRWWVVTDGPVALCSPICALIWHTHQKWIIHAKVVLSPVNWNVFQEFSGHLWPNLKSFIQVRIRFLRRFQSNCWHFLTRKLSTTFQWIEKHLHQMKQKSVGPIFFSSFSSMWREQGYFRHIFEFMLVAGRSPVISF